MSVLPYREGVGIMLLSPTKKAFAAKRIDTKAEAWQMPQGGIDAGETAEIAAMRELGEEVGTKKATIIATSKDCYTYDLPEHLVPSIWGGRYRGQRQRWFVMRFDGVDADINIDTPEPEFLEWKWVLPATLPELIVPFKKGLYSALIQEFRSFL